MKIISRLHGRLGNVMFQIATNLFYAKKYNYEPSFCFSNAIYHSKDLEFFNNNNIADRFSIDLITHENLLRKIKQERFDVIKETSPIVFNELPKSSHSLFVIGNRQSPKYFTKEFCKTIFQPKDNVIERIKLKYPDIESYTSLQIRRGDYIDNINKGNRIFKIFSLGKINNLIKNIEGKVIIISDDINWCKENISGGNIIYSDGDFWEDLWLQTLCKDNIISNSTFGWWGAYLNIHDNRNVYYDAPWFNGIGDGDIIPENDNWININEL